MQSKLKKTAELLKQRRIWAGIIGTVAVVLNLTGTGYHVEGEELTDLFTALGQALSNLTIAILALWSYFRPKE